MTNRWIVQRKHEWMVIDAIQPLARFPEPGGEARAREYLAWLKSRRDEDPLGGGGSDGIPAIRGA